MTAINRTDSTHDNASINQHPQYRKMMETTSREGESSVSIDFGRGIWDTMLDCMAGERQIKSRGTDYLPMTEGMADAIRNNQGTAYIQYRNYIMRACFPENLKKIVTDMQGLIFAAPIKVELPGKLADIINNASVDGKNIEMLAREVTANQMTTGRKGLLLDPQNGSGIVAPKIAEYNEKAIINWGTDEDNVLTWVLLDESKYEADDKTGIHYWCQKYRVLALDRYIDEDTGEDYYGDYYTYTVKDQSNIDLRTPPEGAIYPDIAGRTINYIPFVFVNSNDNSTDCSIPVMMPVANLSLAIYRNSADYELSLFQTAQPTPFISGAQAGDSVAFGANRLINIKSPDAKASFLEISGNGIGLLRQAMQDKTIAIGSFGVEFIENGAESGAALNTRLTIKTASLTNIALTCENGFKMIFRMAAEWCGYNPDDVIFEMNKDFKNDQITAQDIVILSDMIDKGRYNIRDFHKLLLDAQWIQEEDFDLWLEDVQEGIANLPNLAAIENYDLNGGDSEQEEETQQM